MGHEGAFYFVSYPRLKLLGFQEDSLELFGG